MSKYLYSIRGVINDTIAADSRDEAMDAFFESHKDCEDAEIIHEDLNDVEA